MEAEDGSSRPEKEDRSSSEKKGMAKLCLKALFPGGGGKSLRKKHREGVFQAEEENVERRTKKGQSPLRGGGIKQSPLRKVRKERRFKKICELGRKDNKEG